MAFVIGFIWDKIAEVLQNRDTRLDHLPFTSPTSAILVAATYMYFVKHGGPLYMRGRKPFALQTTIIIYNIVQIVLNASLFLYGVYSIPTYKPDYNHACQPIDWDPNILAIMEARGVYHFYCLKLLDLCDTVFFVLKKNTRQVSFLHVYHHVAVLLFTYKAVGWSPGGQFLIAGIINCLVHAIMYTYYLCSVFMPQLKKNIKIKKIVTKIQMAQFLIIIFYYARPLLDPDCPLSKPLLVEVILQNVFLFCLFANFYYKNYCVKKANKKL